ncbi:MAG: histidine phosphatase family protein [Alphaproteobacteria bacterium]|nr:histidine phosphatase family protein [Alphaproteobacteria bacterium]
MTTTVFLVRHGSHDRLGHVLCGRMDGVSLSDGGRKESAALAIRLRGVDLTAVYASPLARTMETATPIAKAAGLAPRSDEDLLEIDFGEWTGERFDALRDDPAWLVWNTSRSLARPPGGESMIEVQARLKRWLDRVRARHPDQRIAAVTHSDVIKALAAHALGFSLDQHGRLEVSPASVSILAAGDWGLKLMSLNETLT